MRKLVCGAILLALGCATGGLPSGAQGEIEGSVLSSDGAHVVLRTSRTETVDLAVTANTRIMREGLLQTPLNLSPGEDVRAAYRMTDGKAEALRILATDTMSEIPRTY